jgi:Na+/proline symporter
MISPLDIAVIIIYLLAVLGLGVYQAFKIRTSGDYYAGGRKFNKFYLMMHALGTASLADEPVSVIGGAYEKGLSGIWYTFLYLPLTPIFWLLAPYIRRTRFVTMADFFRVRYDQSLAVLYAVIGVFKMSVSIAVVLKGTAAVTRAMSGGAISESWAINAMTIVFVTYGFAGGLRATVVTEALQGPLIVLTSLLLLPFGLYQIGGFDALHRALDPRYFDLTAARQEFTPQWIAAASLTALIGFVAQPGIVASFASGKTELEGRVGYTYGTMIKRFLAICWAFTGVILAGMVAHNLLSPARLTQLKMNREDAFGIAMASFMPTGLLGLMFAAILSAQMATLSALMVNSSALASRKLYKGSIRPQATDRQVLIFGRLCGLALVIIGVLMAKFMFKDVADALTALLQFSSIMGVIVWAGVLWKRTNSAGAWAGVIVLLLTWGTLGPAGALLGTGTFSATTSATQQTTRPAEKVPVPLPPAVPTSSVPQNKGRGTFSAGTAPDHRAPQRAEREPVRWLGRYAGKKYIWELMIRYLPAGVLTVIIVSLLTRPPPKKQVEDFFLLLKTPVGQEQQLIDAGVNIIYIGNTVASPLEQKHPRLVHWGGFALAAFICMLILGLLYFMSRIGA